MQTFDEWYNGQEILAQPLFTDFGGYRIVYSLVPELWNLSDFVVTSQNGTIVYLKERRAKYGNSHYNNLGS